MSGFTSTMTACKCGQPVKAQRPKGTPAAPITICNGCDPIPTK